MRKLVWLTALLAAVILTGCETVKGVGRDLTSTSGAVEDIFSRHGK